MLLDMLSCYRPFLIGPLNQGKVFIARCSPKERVLIPFYHAGDSDEVCHAIASGGGANLLSSMGNLIELSNSIPFHFVFRTESRICRAPLCGLPH